MKKAPSRNNEMGQILIFDVIQRCSPFFFAPDSSNLLPAYFDPQDQKHYECDQTQKRL